MDIEKVEIKHLCFISNHLHHIYHSARIAPFVVVPGEDFYQIVADYFGGEGVEDGGEGVFLEVDGY